MNGNKDNRNYSNNKTTMKASELIKQLEDTIRYKGDYEVSVTNTKEDWPTPRDVNRVNVEEIEGNRFTIIYV